METDDDLRNRICPKLPEGSFYFAEDLGNAYGPALDLFGQSFGVTRLDMTPEYKEEVEEYSYWQGEPRPSNIERP